MQIESFEKPRQYTKDDFNNAKEDEYKKSGSYVAEFSFREESVNWKFSNPPITSFTDIIEQKKTASSNEGIFNHTLPKPIRTKRIKKKTPKPLPKTPLQNKQYSQTKLEEYFKEFCFESEDEAAFGNEELCDKTTPVLHFLDLRTETEKSTFTGLRVMNLKDYKTNRKLANNPCKSFRCAHCGACYDTKASLGGHVAQKHANESEDYQIRQEVLRTRKIERERETYLKTMR